MLDAYISQGTVAPEAERRLLAELTDILLEWGVTDPANARTPAASWVFLRGPEGAYVAEEPPERRLAVVEAQHDPVFS